MDIRNLPAGYTLLGALPTLPRPGIDRLSHKSSSLKNEWLYILRRDNYLCLLLKTPSQSFVINGAHYPTEEPGLRVRQLEFPIRALAWIITTIEAGFWKEKSGLSELNCLQRHASIDGEKLRITFIQNYRTDTTKGISIENYSRKGRYLNWQEMGFSLETLLEGKLLDFWKRVIGEYERGFRF